MRAEKVSGDSAHFIVRLPACFLHAGGIEFFHAAAARRGNRKNWMLLDECADDYREAAFISVRRHL